MFVQLFFDGKAKTDLAILAFLYCGEFVKNPIALTAHALTNCLVHFYSISFPLLPSRMYTSPCTHTALRSDDGLETK